MGAKQYRIWKNGGMRVSRVPGRFAIVTTQGVFGRLDCHAGKQAHAENRIFVHSYEDAITYGARPCKVCNPAPNDSYYQCSSCGGFVAMDVRFPSSCRCGRLTVKPMRGGLVLVSGRPGTHRKRAPKKNRTPA